LKRTVIDASVVLKWYLADEKHGEKALGLLNRYISNELDILAPVSYTHLTLPTSDLV